MKFKNPLLVTEDLQRSQQFYREVLGLRVIADFGANVTLTGGVSLQTRETWREFIQRDDSAIALGGNDAELYFEEDDFDGFAQKLAGLPDIQYVHPVFEHRWGQRVVRFYDPDRHIIEVGENLKAVCKRFLDGGMTAEQTAQRMDIPISLVQRLMR